MSFYIQDRENGSYSKAKLSSIEDMIKSRETHLVCMEEFWPENVMWSCLDLATQDEAEEGNSRLRGPRRLYDTSSSDSDSEAHWHSDYDSEFEVEAEVAFNL